MPGASLLHLPDRATAAGRAGRLIVLSFLACSAAIGQTTSTSVAAGDVDSSSAVLWVHSAVAGPVRVEYGVDAGFINPSGARAVQVVADDAPAKIDLTDLDPGRTYYYRVRDASGARASGRFRTAGVDGYQGLRFGVSGDWRGDLAPYPSIANAAERDLDLFVALGDTIYADVPSPGVPASQATTLAEFRTKHAEVYAGRRGVNTLAALRASTAILAMIDDHEVTNDFAGGAAPQTDPRFDAGLAFINETPLFANGLEAFHEYNPIREEHYGDTGDPRTAGKRKLYRYRRYAEDAAFFLLDARSFRDAPIADVSAGASPDDIQAFLDESFARGRTMLGTIQLAELERDLLDADARGVTWKFILVPEPIQNLSPLLAADRFEGYAAERTELLRFITESGVNNVVFVAADIHGTVTNNLTYQEYAGGPQIKTDMFEITTGAVAYAPPFGPTVAGFVDPESLGPLAGFFQFIYGALDARGKDSLVTLVGNFLLDVFALDRIGLGGSVIDARMLRGGYAAMHTFGWTEFEIDAATQRLTVTTWGIDWYSSDDLAANPDEVIARQPRIVSQFEVYPACPDGDDAPPYCDPSVRPAIAQCGVFGLAPFTGSLVGLASVFSRKRR